MLSFFAIKIILLVVGYSKSSVAINFNYKGGLFVYAELISICLLIFLQVAGEEFVIRGFLSQIAYSKLTNVIAVSILTSLIFSMLHGWSGMPLFIMRASISMLLSALCTIGGGLELPVGFHLANNVSAYLGVGLFFEEGGGACAALSVPTLCGAIAFAIFMVNRKSKL
ncbi:hypothetical protein BOC49_21720 (plasmid) [Burkholderia pseudomallei]|nr:hypothetical protein BOC49_21720 [Burkholderia pseudomallei]